MFVDTYPHVLAVHYRVLIVRVDVEWYKSNCFK